jgi:hypothetical protein
MLLAGKGHVSLVSVVFDCELNKRASIRRRGQRVLVLASAPSRAAGRTESPVQWVRVGSFPGVQARPERDAAHSFPASAEVKNEVELDLLSPPTPHPRAPRWLTAGQPYFTSS